VWAGLLTQRRPPVHYRITGAACGPERAPAEQGKQHDERALGGALVAHRPTCVGHGAAALAAFERDPCVRSALLLAEVALDGGVLPNLAAVLIPNHPIDLDAVGEFL
jgi:hypothetical protein